MLYSKIDNVLTKIQEKGFASEKELQTLCEQNLDTLLGLEFIATEFSVTDYRVDTLAYDKEANAFILIEYKNIKIHSVVDQGLSYLATMLNNKAHFVLKFSQHRGKIFDIRDINWEESRVLFISPHFTQYQEGAVNFQGMPIELWKIKRYANESISFEQLGTVKTRNVKDSSNANVNEIFSQVKESENSPIKEIKTYVEEDLVKVANTEIQDLYSILRDFIITENEELSIRATKLYIGFYKNRSPLISVKFYKASLVLWLNTKISEIDDPKKIIKDVTNIGHHGVGDCQIQISDDSNIGYIQDILRKHIQDKG